MRAEATNELRCTGAETGTKVLQISHVNAFFKASPGQGVSSL